MPVIEGLMEELAHLDQYSSTFDALNLILMIDNNVKIIFEVHY